jgi:hypothetical protein
MFNVVKNEVKNVVKNVVKNEVKNEVKQVPKIVFIVPYRNRPQHKYFFSNYLITIMEERTDYELYFSHQCDERPFNRGGTKNIGFLAIKNKYPEHYKDITFVFNDIDTIPFSTIFDFETVDGIVKHFYGFEYALGGIVSIKGSDFEAINGYPNLWGWGMEDTVLQNRCEKIGLKIDRSQFYPIGSPDILHLFDGVSRIINREDSIRYKNDNGVDGIRTIRNLNYNINSESKNPIDNINIVLSSQIFIININNFNTNINPENNSYYKYDLREPPQKINNPQNMINNSEINHVNQDWSNIPLYPTAKQKSKLIREFGEKRANEIIKYNYNNTGENNNNTNIKYTQQSHSQQSHSQFQSNEVRKINEKAKALLEIQKYNELMRQRNSSYRIIPPNVNKFSPAYSRIIAAKPRATSSVKNIKMGGLL